MKTFLPLVFISAILHAESLFADTQPPAAPAPAAPAPAVETHAESAESAESGSPAGGAGERSEPEGVSHAEPAEPAAPGGGVVAGNDATGGNDRQLELVDNSPPSSERGVARSAGGSASCGSKHCAKRRPPLRAEVSLIDGSVLKGVLRQHAIPARSRNLGDIRVRLGKVESIAFGKPGAPAKIAFRNGDALTARFPADRAFVTLDTLVGRVRVPFDKVASLAIASETTHSSLVTRHSSLVTRHSSLLYYCTFDSASSIAHPAAGPAGKFLGGEFVPGKNGKALLVKARTPAAEVPFSTGLMQPEGCIEFWAKIPGATKETRYPDGGNPQFFAMGVGKYVNTFVKYTSNDGFGTSGLHADLPGSAYVSSSPSTGAGRYPDFLGVPSAWHHYALVWSEKGLDKASEALGRRVVSALYVDGRLVNPAYGTNGPDRAKFLREFVENPVVLAFPFLRDRQDPKQGQVDYLIDEFKIWSVPKFDSVGASVVPDRQYKPELLYHCTFDSAAAIERPAAGPNGRFLGGEFVPGKKGNALRTFADEPAAEADFEPGVLGPRGTIEFWAKKEKSEKGSFAETEGLRFFGLWLYAKGETPPWCSTHFQFTSNDGMGMSGLCGMVNHCSWATKPSFGGWPYDIIRDSLFDWHHYAVVWDAEGLPGTKAPDGGPAVVQVYLDGKPVSTQGRQTVSFGGKHLRDIAPQWGKLAFPTPSNGWNPSRSHIPFLIDEFKIWSAPKTDF